MPQLHHALQAVRSEDDVEDIYIKALGLGRVSKGLIDIQTDEIWFEAKDTGRHACCAMFTQLLHCLQQTLDKGEKVPPFLAVIDNEKAALTTAHIARADKRRPKIFDSVCCSVEYSPQRSFSPACNAQGDGA